MKKVGVFLASFLMVIALVVIPAAALASLDSVDIGDPTSEEDHSLEGWGPIEPATSGGIYGGVPNCRCTWEPSDPVIDTKRARSASFVLRVPKGKQATSLELMVLAGLADDSFEVYVRGKDAKGKGNTNLYYHHDAPSNTENWIPHTITFSEPVQGRVKVEIKAIGESWPGFETFGQLAVDYAELLE